MLLLLVACSAGPPDPRPGLRARWAGLRSVKLDAAQAFRDARYGEACAALKLSLAGAPGASPAEEAGWARLLTVAARDPACLDGVDGDAIAEWGAGRKGWTDAVGEWRAGRGLYVDPVGLAPDSRLSVALRGDSRAPVVDAALLVLAEDPQNARACSLLVQDDIDRGELLLGLGRCPDVHTSALVRLRAAALDEAGRFEEAVAAYDTAGFTLHSAAVLYQERADLDDEVARRLDEPVRPAALHRAWFDLLRGRSPRLTGLDESHEALLVRALAGDTDSVAALQGVPGVEAKVLHARLTGSVEPLDALLAADPDNDVVWRARLGVALEQGFDLEESLGRLAARDPDHLRLRHPTPRREAPWSAIVPWTWERLRSRLPALAAVGEDDVGRNWRRAVAQPESERSAALAELQTAHPELRGLARFRAGGSILDGPAGLR